VGYGHIGTQLGILAENLGMRVYYYDIENKLSLGNATQIGTMSELLNKCDVISLHVPETPDTQDMMGAEEFARMKPGSIFINAARCTVVDIDTSGKPTADKVEPLSEYFTIFPATSMPIFSCASCVEPPMCGVSSTLSNWASGE